MQSARTRLTAYHQALNEVQRSFGDRAIQVWNLWCEKYFIDFTDIADDASAKLWEEFKVICGAEPARRLWDKWNATLPHPLGSDCDPDGDA